MILSVISAICRTVEFLSRQVASVTTTVTRGAPKHMKSAICSSTEFASRSRSRQIYQYMLSLCVKFPFVLPTVFPGQFPVCWFRPVRLLNTVLLPVLDCLPAQPPSHHVLPILFQIYLSTGRHRWTALSNPFLIALTAGLPRREFLTLLRSAARLRRP